MNNIKIYFAHPFSTYGDMDENVKNIERLIINAVKQDKTITPISPLHATGFLFDHTTYEEGMSMCFDLLKDCDMLCLCGEWQKSNGVGLEIKYAKEHGIEIVEYDYLFL